MVPQEQDSAGGYSPHVPQRGKAPPYGPGRAELYNITRLFVSSLPKGNLKQFRYDLLK